MVRDVENIFICTPCWLILSPSVITTEQFNLICCPFSQSTASKTDRHVPCINITSTSTLPGIMSHLATTNATLGATMRGVMYSGIPFNVTVDDIPMPIVQDSTDVIVKITTSALCGSDLHVYRGVQGGTPPWNMGHEAIGYVLEKGNAVSALDVGDYVIIPDAVSHEHFEQEIQPLDFFGNGATLTQGLQCK
jgi:hypothetical protein